MVPVHAPIGEDEDVVPFLHRLQGFIKEMVQGFLHFSLTLGGIEE